MPSSKLGMSWQAQFAALWTLLAGLAFAFAGVKAAAAQDRPACEQFAWSLHREQALFGASQLKTAPSGAVVESLESGIDLELLPNGTVPFVLPPARQPKTPESYGGVITIANLPKAGTWQITASGEAWIDVVQNGKAAASIAHTGKRDCEAIRKSVRFELQPGPVTLQVGDAPEKAIKLAVLPAG